MAFFAIKVDIDARHARDAFEGLLHVGDAVLAHHAFNMQSLFHERFLSFEGILNAFRQFCTQFRERRFRLQEESAAMPLPAHARKNEGFHVRKRRALLTTHTELRLMAAAAIMGLSVRPAHENAPAATGMQIAL